MFRLLGALMIAGGAAMAGFGAVHTLSLRMRLLQQLTDALQYMKSEIAFTLAPLPVVIAHLAADTHSPVRDFFRECEKRLEDLGTVPFSSIWSDSLSLTLGRLLRAQEMDTLRELGGMLGRYGSEQQAESIEHCIRRLGRFLETAEDERSRLGRLYGAMGILSGVAAVIILI